MALRLKRKGITRIRPLHGGLTLWMTREFPVEELAGQMAAAGSETSGLAPIDQARRPLAG